MVEETNKEDDKCANSFANRISSLCSKKLELDAILLSMWSKNLVYMALGEDSVLYIGMSTQGLSRVFDHKHHVLSNIHSLVKSMMLFETNDERTARQLERVLIAEFHPQYNLVGIKGKRKHKQAA
jgi:predicted GIY-YIG superfamily endonuclease